MCERSNGKRQTGKAPVQLHSFDSCRSGRELYIIYVGICVVCCAQYLLVAVILLTHCEVYCDMWAGDGRSNGALGMHPGLAHALAVGTLSSASAFSVKARA